MFTARFLFLVPIFSLAAYCQKPVIFPGGVVNAASYVQGGSDSSIVSIFGTDLAASTETAATVPLPVRLAGTAVTVDGIPAPLFYVSPGQINFQMPFHAIPASQRTGIVVSTTAGVSDPFSSDLPYRFGIFTRDASGCGPGAVLNVKGDGTISVNSPSNSLSPGEYISVFGTGLGAVINWPPDGMPASSSPLAFFSGPYGLHFDFSDYVDNSPFHYVGRAPGLIGVDQVNIQVQDTVREGCAVPLQVEAAPVNISQPVTISIHKGGGACVDPPPAGYGQITWEKTVTTSPSGSTSETDSVSMSLQTSPGKQAPSAPVLEPGVGRFQYDYVGPSCPLPGYGSLDAGAVSVQGPGFGPTQAPLVPLPKTQVNGLKLYQAALPSGAIQPGSFSVNAGGGADVGAFQSTVRIGSPIQVTTSLAGKTLPSDHSLKIDWTGGDPDAWVTCNIVFHGDTYDHFRFDRARASDGTITIGIFGFPGGGFGIAGPVEIILEVTPDLSQPPAFSAPGLSLGGQHLWKYSYRFEGIVTQ